MELTTVNDPIEVPVKGESLKVQWGVNVANRLNSIGAACPADMLLVDGGTGTGFSPLPKNRRDRVWKHLPGCFEWAGTVDEDGNKFYGRPYYMIGSRLYRAQDEDVECGSTKGIDFLSVTLDKGQIKAEVGHAEDYAELQEQTDDKDHAIIPLYEIGEGGSPVADLRTMPLISSWEFST